MNNTETVLVVGNYRPSISVVRSLGRAGHRVIVGREPWASYAERSRYAAEVWDHPSIETDEAHFIEALQTFLKDQPDIGFIFPVRGLAIISLCRHLSQIPSHVKLVMPDPDLVEICDHKTKMLSVVAELGIPYPAFAIVASFAELLEKAETIGYPCIIKPTVAELRIEGEKGLICQTATALQQQLLQWPPGHTTLMVQRYATGWRHNLHFVAKDGELLRCLDAISLRTQRPDGTGLTVQGISVALPDALHDYCRQLVSRLDYTGIGCLQFLCDENTGSTDFLEINPRLAAGYAIAQYCGLDLPLMALNLVRGVPIATESNNYPIGKRFAWTQGDLAGLKVARRQGEITNLEAIQWFTNAVKSFIRADMHLTWNWHDPSPALAIYARAFGYTLPRKR
jgi:carbamoylphosphate synthase large subunit